MTPKSDESPAAFRVGVDIGGTFTDIVFLNPDGQIYTKKIASTVDDYSRGILDGLKGLFDEVGLQGEDVAEVIHGTTVASNAVLESKGAKTGLITTAGFRDVLEFRRMRMPRLYDLTWVKPTPLIERYLRVEVNERINGKGEINEPLDRPGVDRALSYLQAQGIEALAVCLINSYANPVHEREIKALVQHRAPDLSLSISSEVLPEIKEYERTSTTVINAYVMPVVQRYLSRVHSGLTKIGTRGPLLIMQSNGGLMSAEAATRTPIHIIESGPAAGVVGAQVIARQMCLPKVITCDMGGTTAKASIIEGGEITRNSEIEVGGGIVVNSRLLTGAGYLLRTPAIDLAEVGAGGGSIVWIDAGGSLQVGPKSAGASPGPVCYDQGGTEPTVTDANVILGYLNPTHLLGGSVQLNARLSHEVFSDRIGRPLGLSAERAAYGAHLIATANMIRAIRAVSSERGRDPREYVLFVFGGNGPLFGTAMARALEMQTIVVPPSAGLFSSFGLLYAETQHHYTRTYRCPIRRLDPANIERLWSEIEVQAIDQLAVEGFVGASARIRRLADLCYHGQSFELTVPVPAGMLTPAGVEAIEEAFGLEHERTYGHRAGPGEPVDLVNLRVIAEGISHRSRVPEHVRVDGRLESRPTAPRPVYFGVEHGWKDTPVILRKDLATPRRGPLIIEEYDTTCVIPPLDEARLDAHGNIIIKIEPDGLGRAGCEGHR
jgi:N-methylhydantoinase A